MRSAGVRAWPGIAGLALCFCALFFGNGPLALQPVVWIGGLALLAGAVAVLWSAPPGGPALAYLGCLFGLALWCGITIVWSASPDRSWIFTNRTLAYAGFALLGVLIGAGSGGGRAAAARPEDPAAVGSGGPQLERVAAAATAVVAAVLGWALLAKCIPALYSDYGRLSRLRAPLDDWNMLALVCVAAVPLALWLAARHSRTAGTVLLYAAVVALLLTYSRFGVALACLAAAGWAIRERRDRVESLGAIAAAAVVGGGVYGIALALDGITADGAARSVRAHDGWVFALVLLAGAALVALAVRFAPHVPEERRRGIERAAATAAVVVAVAGLAVTLARASSVWHEFTNPAASQVSNASGRVTSFGSGNRWAWWQEAWHGFTGRPLGGTGAGTFQLTDLRLRSSSDVTALEPHNLPLQFLSETGTVGFLLFLGAAGVALWFGFRRPGPLPLVVAAFFAHSVVNYDWSFLAVCGPFLLLGGVLVAREQRETARRPLAALAAVAFALACAYSLAAPWLAQRAEARLDLARAHSYDPLSTDVLTLQAALATDPQAAERFYRDAVALEPTNSALWLEFARFYAEAGDWVHAYRALTHAYENDPLGPAGQCGLAQQIRRKVGVGSTCRGAGSPSIP